MRKLEINELYDGIIVQCRGDYDGIPFPALYLLYRENGLFKYKGIWTHGLNLDKLTRNGVLLMIQEQCVAGESDIPMAVWYETDLTIRLNVEWDRNRKLEELGI